MQWTWNQDTLGAWKNLTFGRTTLPSSPQSERVSPFRTRNRSGSIHADTFTKHSQKQKQSNHRRSRSCSIPCGYLHELCSQKQEINWNNSSIHYHHRFILPHIHNRKSHLRQELPSRERRPLMFKNASVEMELGRPCYENLGLSFEEETGLKIDRIFCTAVL